MASSVIFRFGAFLNLIHMATIPSRTNKTPKIVQIHGPVFSVAKKRRAIELAVSAVKKTLISRNLFIYSAIEVGTPVTRCPPRRSRRAELPHRAPQESAHMEPAPTQSARNRFPLQAGSLTPCSGVIVSRGGCFACVAFPPAPSPCDRCYRLLPARYLRGYINLQAGANRPVAYGIPCVRFSHAVSPSIRPSSRPPGSCCSRGASRGFPMG